MSPARLEVWFSGERRLAPAFISRVLAVSRQFDGFYSRQKWPRLRGHFPLVPVMVTPDDYVTVTISMIPSAMRGTVMSIEPSPRTVIVAVAIVPVAADPHTKSLSACDCRGRNGDGC